MITPLIIGGKKTKNGEFPHMAGIGFKSLKGDVDFKCGGSLISDEYVLTAAHCLRSGGTAPSIIRLGDQNIYSTKDGLKEVDIPIAKIIKHENYSAKTKYNDIALLKLSKKVEFTKYIRPACLWQTSDTNNSKIIATGWGLTEAFGEGSDELLKVGLDIINNDDCNHYLDDLDNKIIDTQMCAGELKGGKDSCNGGELKKNHFEHNSLNR